MDEPGCSVEDALKITVYLAEIDDFEAMTKVYVSFSGRI
ncbi:RidA family protein (plasmid) [Haloarcula sp. JP-L23]|nr:RidA family protein [Haloarcula sp. JP-L23]